MRDAGGLLETGLARSSLGAVVFLFAPLLLIANVPFPGIVGALWMGAGVVMMLRAPSSPALAWWLRGLALVLLGWLAVTAVALFGAIHSYLPIASMALYAAAFSMYAAALARLTRDLGQGRIARRWTKAGAYVVRAGVAVVGITAIAVASHQLSAAGSRYSFSSTGVASLSMITPIAVIVVVALRNAHLMARTREALQAHLEVEPLRRLRAAVAHR